MLLRPMSSLEIEYQPEARPATAMLYLKGRAGFRESHELRDVLFRAIDTLGDKNLVVDLEGLDSLDTAAMAVLVEGLVATRDAGPDLFLVGAGESVDFLLAFFISSANILTSSPYSFPVTMLPFTS